MADSLKEWRKATYHLIKLVLRQAKHRLCVCKFVLGSSVLVGMQAHICHNLNTAPPRVFPVLKHLSLGPQLSIFRNKLAGDSLQRAAIDLEPSRHFETTEHIAFAHNSVFVEIVAQE